jgi:hypothetical protein
VEGSLVVTTVLLVATAVAGWCLRRSAPVRV